jgi:hypothetical protein
VCVAVQDLRKQFGAARQVSADVSSCTSRHFRYSVTPVCGGVRPRRTPASTPAAGTTATTDNTGLILGIVGTAIGLIALVLAFLAWRPASVNSGGTRSSANDASAPSGYT